MKKILILSMTAFLVVLQSCQSGGGNPKEVLNHFFDALASKNVDAAKKYVTKDSEGMMGMMQMAMQQMPDSSSEFLGERKNMEIGDAVITGDRATVPVKDKRSGETTDFVLKKEGGAWKVAFDKSTLTEMATKKMKEHGMNMGDMNGMGDMNADSLKEKMGQAMDSLKAAMPEMKDKMGDAKKMLDSAREMLDKRNKNTN